MILRHRDRPELDVAFLGGIDLCHGRRDDASHRGDPQPQPMAAAYGPRPPWHDIQLAISGPAVGDVETVFRERWENPQALSRSPIRWLGDRARHDNPSTTPLPPQHPDPEPRDLTRYSCYAPIHAAWVATRSHLRESEAWHAATPKPSTRPGT